MRQIYHTNGWAFYSHYVQDAIQKTARTCTETGSVCVFLFYFSSSPSSRRASETCISSPANLEGAEPSGKMASVTMMAGGGTHRILWTDWSQAAIGVAFNVVVRWW